MFKCMEVGVGERVRVYKCVFACIRRDFEIMKFRKKNLKSNFAEN